MAYEKEIKAALKNKFHARLGLSDGSYEKVANILGATEGLKEDEIETVVTGAEAWLKVAQSEADTARKGKKEPNPKDPKDPKDPDKKDPDPDPNSIEAIIAKATAPLMQKIEALEKGNSAKATQERLVSMLEGKKIDKSFYEAAIEGREFGTDDELNNFVEKISGAYEKFSQSLADKGLSNVPKPILGDPNKDSGISSATQAYIAAKSEEGKASPLGGKGL